MKIYTEKEWAKLAQEHPDYYGQWNDSPYNQSRVEAGELPAAIIGKRNRMVWDEKSGTVLETEGVGFYIGDVLPLHFPANEYEHENVDGREITRCTMRQKVLHTIGMDGIRHKPYTRHGKKFYRPWRNFFTTDVFDADWCHLAAAGYAAHGPINKNWCTTYYITDTGREWLSHELGITIHPEQN